MEEQKEVQDQETITRQPLIEKSQSEPNNLNSQDSQSQQKCSEMLDLSDMFKTKIPMRFSNKLNDENKIKQQFQINDIPKNLEITQDIMKERRFLDERRWFCISRSQYERSCGISSLISVWNYLFTTLGVGDLNPISQEEGIQLLNIVKEEDADLQQVEFGAFTGNTTLLKWFKRLCQIFKQEGRAFVLFKPSGQGKTQIDADYALQKIEEGLRSDNTCFIYHSFDHYHCPIGYEICASKQADAYKSLKDIDPQNLEHWLLVGDTADTYPCFHIRKWKDIVMDLTLETPKYYDIREPWKGVREYKNSEPGNTIHCIMSFQKVIKKQIKKKASQ